MCVKDPEEDFEVRKRTCLLPKYQYEEGFKPLLKHACLLDGGEKYHFNPMSGACESFDYLGCFGTDNVHDSEEECRKTCFGETELRY